MLSRTALLIYHLRGVYFRRLLFRHSWSSFAVLFFYRAFRHFLFLSSYHLEQHGSRVAAQAGLGVWYVFIFMSAICFRRVRSRRFVFSRDRSTLDRSQVLSSSCVVVLRPASACFVLFLLCFVFSGCRFGLPLEALDAGADGDVRTR